MDASRYKSVAINYHSYSQLGDLSNHNKTPISKSAMVAYLIDKEWKRQQYLKQWFRIDAVKKLFQGSRLSEVKSNDN